MAAIVHECHICMVSLRLHMLMLPSAMGVTNAWIAPSRTCPIQLHDMLFVDPLPSGWLIAATPFATGASGNGSTSVY